MDKNKTFCEECRRDIEYSLETVNQSGNLKGEEFEFTGEKAICGICGSEVYVDEVEDRNLKSLYDAYRKKKGIIPLDRILEIPHKYNIGKRPLSLLLGWGELTYSRYCDGDMPTKQYSYTMERVCDDPGYYKTILENNKENLKSPTAYYKSMRKVEELLGENTNTELKLLLTAKYLLYRCEDITPMALQKALYYVQGFHYAFTGSFLFSNDCEAWVHGPVYRDIYNRYADYRFNPIEGENDFDVSVFTGTEKAVIDSVVLYLCCYSGKVLENFTHSEVPWIKTRGDLPAYVNSNRIINKEMIGEYFTAVKAKHNMLRFDDIETYSKKMFGSMLRYC